MTGRELRYWESEYHGGSAEEPQKNHRKREGDLCQCDEQVSYHGITILLTATPKDHDWHLDKMSLLDIYTAWAQRKMFSIDHFLWGAKH